MGLHKYWIAVLVLAILIGSCRPIPPPSCKDEGRACLDGSIVKRVLPHCEFAPCPPMPDSGTCTLEQHQAEYCMEMYDPVCGTDGKSYGNYCFACKEGADSWRKGSCEI